MELFTTIIALTFIGLIVGAIIKLTASILKGCISFFIIIFILGWLIQSGYI